MIDQIKTLALMVTSIGLNNPTPDLTTESVWSLILALTPDIIEGSYQKNGQ